MDPHFSTYGLFRLPDFITLCYFKWSPTKTTPIFTFLWTFRVQSVFLHISVIFYKVVKKPEIPLSCKAKHKRSLREVRNSDQPCGQCQIRRGPRCFLIFSIYYSNKRKT